MTCCHHYSVYYRFCETYHCPSPSPSHHRGLRFCHSLGWNINGELRNGSRGLAFFFGCRCQELKNHSSSPLRTGFEKEMDMSFPIPGNFFFFWRLFFEILIYFNFSNPSKLPENRSGEDWRELSINWFLPLEALCVRSWCLERFRRFIALQWSKTPWSQFGKRPGIFGLDWIFWYLS